MLCFRIKKPQISEVCVDICVQVETLSKELTEKTDAIESLKREVENSEQQRLNVVEQLNEISVDKALVESDLKNTRTELQRLKKDHDVRLSYSCVEN